MCSATESTSICQEEFTNNWDITLTRSAYRNLNQGLSDTNSTHSTQSGMFSMLTHQHLIALADVLRNGNRTLILILDQPPVKRRVGRTLTNVPHLQDNQFWSQLHTMFYDSLLTQSKNDGTVNFLTALAVRLKGVKYWTPRTIKFRIRTSYSWKGYVCFLRGTLLKEALQ